MSLYTPIDIVQPKIPFGVGTLSLTYPAVNTGTDCDCTMVCRPQDGALCFLQGGTMSEG